MYIKDLTFLNDVDKSYINNNIASNTLQNYKLLNKILNKEIKDNLLLKTFQQEYRNFVSKNDPDIYNQIYKYNSLICAKIYLSKFYLDCYDIDINKTLKLIQCWVYNGNIINTKEYHKVPDRFLCQRIGISRSKLYILINLFKKLDILCLKTDKRNNFYVKFNSIVFRDELFKNKENNYFYNNTKIYLKCISTANESLYYEKLTKTTIMTNIRKNIILITLAYNELLRTDPVYARKIAVNGNRQDIKYTFIPLDLLCFMFGYTKQKLMKYINNLCNNTPYITKHDKAYVDTGIIDHYLNDFYRSCDLKHYKDITLEEGHPPVNEYTFIWFREPLEKSKYYKEFDKNYRKYKKIVKNNIILSYFNYGSNLIIGAEEIDIKNTLDKANEYDNLIRKAKSKALDTASIKAKQLVELIDKGAEVIDIAFNDHKETSYKPYLLHRETINNLNLSETLFAYIRTMISITKSNIYCCKRLNEQREYLILSIQDKFKSYCLKNYKQALKWKDKIENLNEYEEYQKFNVIFDYIPLSVIEPDIDNNTQEEDDYIKIREERFLKRKQNICDDEDNDNDKLTKETLNLYQNLFC